MKKTLSIIIAVIFLLSVSAVAFASTSKGVFAPKDTTVTSTTITNTNEKNTSVNENSEKIHEIESLLTAQITKITVGDSLLITATTRNHAQFVQESWTVKLNTQTEPPTEPVTTTSKVEPPKVEGNFVSTYEFKPTSAGFYTISYEVVMDAGVNTGKFIGTGSITIEVIAKTDSKVKSFKITKAHISNQDKGNAKQALYIEQLEVTYEDGTVKTEVPFEYKIGNIYSKEARMFDVTYEGVTQQFEAAKVLAACVLPAYPGPKVEVVNPGKAKQAEKPAKPENPGNPDKPVKPERPTNPAK